MLRSCVDLRRARDGGLHVVVEHAPARSTARPRPAHRSPRAAPARSAVPLHENARPNFSSVQPRMRRNQREESELDHLEDDGGEQLGVGEDRRPALRSARASDMIDAKMGRPNAQVTTTRNSTPGGRRRMASCRRFTCGLTRLRFLAHFRHALRHQLVAHACAAARAAAAAAPACPGIRARCPAGGASGSRAR